VARANLVVALVDAAAGGGAVGEADAAILAQLPAALPRIVVHNKIDLLRPGAAARAEQRGGDRHVWLSAKTGEGLDLLRREVLAVADAHEDMEGTFLARERHLVALREAQLHLATAAGHLDVVPPPLELFAEELREAQDALAEITGEFTPDDLLGVIFSRFCIGK
jgi:tRNA modification GTPase